MESIKMDNMKSEKTPQILIVDDVDINLVILSSIINGMGYVSRCASRVKEAANMINEELPQLIILDIFMPEINGFEFCEKLKKNVRTRDIPIIFISADSARENIWKGFELGGADFITKPFDTQEVAMRVNTHLKMYQMQQELAETNKYLHHVIEDQMKRIEGEQRNTLYALTKLTEEENEGRNSHMDNVGYNSRILAQGLQLSPRFEESISENFIEEIAIASMLHDIGKLLLPPGTVVDPLLDEDEKALWDLAYHAEQGAVILEKIYNFTNKNDFLAMAIDIAKYHHTRWDGAGLPKGISGKDIPLAARIVAVVDIYDVINEDYKDKITPEEGLALIEKRAGTYYDPEIVQVFLKIKGQMKKG